MTFAVGKERIDPGGSVPFCLQADFAGRFPGVPICSKGFQLRERNVAFLQAGRDVYGNL